MNSNEPNETELMEAFDEIFSGLADEISATSFITLLQEKRNLFKEKQMCLSCAIKSAREKTSKLLSQDRDTISFESIQISDSDKYADISFLTDIIMSANGVNVSKYSITAPFKKNRSFSTAKAFNIQIKSLQDDFYDDFEKANFLYLNLSNQEAYYKYLNNISRVLPFENVLNVTEKFLNPCKVKNQFITVNSKEDVEEFANICLNIKNENSIIVYSSKDIPFASTNGETTVAEAWKNKIFTYNLTPELLGLQRGIDEDIRCESIEQNKDMILKLFNNDNSNQTLYNTAVLNSGLALYIVKKANSLMDGVSLAKKTINDGVAKQKLEQIQKIYS